MSQKCAVCSAHKNVVYCTKKSCVSQTKKIENVLQTVAMLGTVVVVWFGWFVVISPLAPNPTSIAKQ